MDYGRYLYSLPKHIWLRAHTFWNRTLGAPTYLTTHIHQVAQKYEGQQAVENLHPEIEIDKGGLKPSYLIKPGRARGSYGVEIADQAGFTDEEIGKLIREQ